MRVVSINKLPDGSHYYRPFYSDGIPEGYALLPDTIETINFPFGDIEIKWVEDIYIVTKWIPGVNPYEVELTPVQLREQAYNTEKVIEWESSMITVTEASQLWQYYAAEGSLKANTLQELIANAKSDIRLKYPD